MEEWCGHDATKIIVFGTHRLIQTSEWDLPQHNTSSLHVKHFEKLFSVSLFRRWSLFKLALLVAASDWMNLLFAQQLSVCHLPFLNWGMLGGRFGEKTNPCSKLWTVHQEVAEISQLNSSLDYGEKTEDLILPYLIQKNKKKSLDIYFNPFAARNDSRRFHTQSGGCSPWDCV